MNDIIENGNWTERLLKACSFEAHSIEEEQKYFRKVAELAPLNELEIFLSTSPGRFDEPARAVMQQVYNQRLLVEQKAESEKQNRIGWWRTLFQQISAQIIGALIIGIIIGFITGVGFSK